MNDSLPFFFFFSDSRFHFASQGEQGSDGAAGKDVSDVICSPAPPSHCPTHLPLNRTGGDVLFFFSPALVLTGRSRTPRRPRSPGSKSKEFTPVDASSVHSVRICPGETSVTASADCCRRSPLFSAPSGRPGHSTTFLPSQHSGAKHSHQFTNSTTLACTSLLLAF